MWGRPNSPLCLVRPARLQVFDGEHLFAAQFHFHRWHAVLQDCLQQFVEFDPVSLPRQRNRDLRPQSSLGNAAVWSLLNDSPPAMNRLIQVAGFKMQFTQSIRGRITHRRDQESGKDLREFRQVLLYPPACVEQLFSLLHRRRDDRRLARGQESSVKARGQSCDWAA